MALGSGSISAGRKKEGTLRPLRRSCRGTDEAGRAHAKEKRFNELKAAATELKELSRKMSDEIEAGGKDVISAKLWSNLDRAEKLVKTMREKAK